MWSRLCFGRHDNIVFMGPGSNKFNNVNSICVGEDGMNSLFECEYLDLYDENINNHLDRSRNILMNYAQNYEIPILYLFL